MTRSEKIEHVAAGLASTTFDMFARDASIVTMVASLARLTPLTPPEERQAIEAYDRQLRGYGLYRPTAYMRGADSTQRKEER
jgi:predicted anti-sigma-YlaC factor YlaD